MYTLTYVFVCVCVCVYIYIYYLYIYIYKIYICLRLPQILGFVPGFPIKFHLFIYLVLYQCCDDLITVADQPSVQSLKCKFHNSRFRLIFWLLRSQASCPSMSICPCGISSSRSSPSGLSLSKGSQMLTWWMASKHTEVCAVRSF